MYKVALIQNQSEMSHYGYADARGFFEKTALVEKYKVELYTAQNINLLTTDILQGRIDSIILASHATNDITIFGVVFSDEFKDALNKLLARGGGLLVLHQLRLGEKALVKAEDGRLSFLPDKLCTLTAMAREKGESYLEGNFCKPKSNPSDYLLNFPREIDLNEVKNKCLDNIGLKGCYWHYWYDVDSGVWDVVLEDRGKGRFRPLILSAKESTNVRVVVSSLTLDWQDQTEVLENLLSYVIEGKHHVAFLKCEQDIDIDIQYFAERLRSKRLPYAEYNIPQKDTMAQRTLSSGLHSIVITTELAYEAISQPLKEILERKKNDGKIKIVLISKGKFTVSGREQDELRLFYKLKMDALGELNNNYIDGSFWGTVESLQAISQIDKKADLTKDQLGLILEKIKVHDNNDGSYDGVFGASCALLWLRSTYLGPEDNDTQRTLKWLYDSRTKYNTQEILLLLQTMWETHTFSPYNKEVVIEEMESVLKKIDKHSINEMNAAIFLKCANILKQKNELIKIINELYDKQNDGIWIDVATTASIVSQLLEARDMLANDPSYDMKRLNLILFSAVTAIQKNADNVGDPLMPWGKKISINLRCIEALLKFDQLIELPITEIIDSIDTYAKLNNNSLNLENSLSVLTELSRQLLEYRQKEQVLSGQLHDNENQTAQQLRDSKDKVLKMHKRYKISSIVAWVGAILSSVFLYMTVLFAFYLGGHYVDTQSFGSFFIEQFGWHLGYIAIVVASSISIALGIKPIKIEDTEMNHVKDKDNK